MLPASRPLISFCDISGFEILKSRNFPLSILSSLENIAGLNITYISTWEANKMRQNDVSQKTLNSSQRVVNDDSHQRGIGRLWRRSEERRVGKECRDEWGGREVERSG